MSVHVIAPRPVAERLRWFARVRELVSHGTPVCRAMRVADLAARFDQLEAEQLAAWWLASGHYRLARSSPWVCRQCWLSD